MRSKILKAIWAEKMNAQKLARQKLYLEKLIEIKKKNQIKLVNRFQFSKYLLLFNFRGDYLSRIQNQTFL